MKVTLMFRELSGPGERPSYLRHCCQHWYPNGRTDWRNVCGDPSCFSTYWFLCTKYIVPSCIFLFLSSRDVLFSENCYKCRRLKHCIYMWKIHCIKVWENNSFRKCATLVLFQVSVYHEEAAIDGITLGVQDHTAWKLYDWRWDILGYTRSAHIH